MSDLASASQMQRRHVARLMFVPHLRGRRRDRAGQKQPAQTLGPVAWGSVVLDCADPPALARFYQGSWAARWAPHWPDGHPEYVRLDLSVPEFGTPHNSITSLGAVPLDPVEPPTDPDDRPYRIYADPAGHPFSLHLN